MNKKALCESDICDRYISPALERAGWDSSRWRREYGFTDGRIIVRGKVVARGKRKRADYLLFHRPNLPIALIEAKDNNHSVGGGMQQGLACAANFVPSACTSWTSSGRPHEATSGNSPRSRAIPANRWRAVSLNTCGKVPPSTPSR